MSLKFEQYRALHSTREFMWDLLRPGLTPGVPRSIRDRASRCLRHFPLLKENGEPMFSRDEFECPAIERPLT